MDNEADVTLDDLRRAAVARSLFPPTTLQRALDALGFVQADPIRAPARAQDLTLRHRVTGYRAGDLERRYARLDVHEDFFVNYGFVTSAVQALMHPRGGPTPWTAARGRHVRALLDFVRARGAVHPREVDAHFSHGTVTNYWGGSSSATTHLLDADALSRSAASRPARGRNPDLRGARARRRSRGRRHSPCASRRARRRRRREVRTAARGEPVDPGETACAMRPRSGRASSGARCSGPSGDSLTRGSRAWTGIGRQATPSAASEPDDEVRLLAPFDPVVWDRRRFEILWGWAYRFEAYTPVPKRKLGYYALPLLWRDRVIGWANVSAARRPPAVGRSATSRRARRAAACSGAHSRRNWIASASFSVCRDSDLMYAARHRQLSQMEITMKPVRLIFTFGALVLSAAVAYAQGGQDFSKVEIKANKVTDKFYTLDGQGGTIGVLIGPDGVFMVDTQFAPLSDKIAAAIKQLTPQPIKFVVNTHVHGDHSGGDENFGKMGATIISREELRFRLAHPNPQANGQPGVPTAAVGLPKQTYREKLTLHMNGEEVQLIAIPRAHTDGDTMVYFPGLDIIMTGDFYRAIEYPNVDRANGGSLQGLIDGLGSGDRARGPEHEDHPGPRTDRRPHRGDGASRRRDCRSRPRGGAGRSGQERG